MQAAYYEYIILYVLSLTYQKIRQLYFVTNIANIPLSSTSVTLRILGLTVS